jgi:hypothetical protein
MRLYFIGIGIVVAMWTLAISWPNPWPAFVVLLVFVLIGTPRLEWKP